MTQTSDESTYRTYVGGRLVDSGVAEPAGLAANARRLVPLAVGAAALVLDTLLIAHAWNHYDQPLWVALPVQLAGIPFVVCGVLLWLQRRGTYLGPFCLALGVLWYAGNLQSFEVEALFAAGFSLYHLNVAMLAHLALLVPDGRLRDRWEVAVVSALYATMPSLQFLRYLDVRSEIDMTRFGDVTAHPSVWAGVATFVGVPLAVVAVALVLRHYREAIPAERRSYAVFWIAALVLGIAAFAAALLETWRSDIVQQAALAVFALSFAATAIGLILGAVKLAPSTRSALRGLTRHDANLEHAVAAALGDPHLRLYVREGGDWRRESDQPVPERTEAATPPARTIILRSGEPEVLILHQPVIAFQRLLMFAVTSMIVSAVARQRLARTRNEAVLDGQDAERHRISQDLHDEARGSLSAIVRRANSIAGRLPHSAERADLEELARAAGTLQIRLAQIVDDLYPADLAEDGLAQAVDQRLRALHVPGAPVVAAVVPHRRWHPLNERTAYFVISEALNNLMRHSGATTARVEVSETDGIMHIVVSDNGRGRGQLAPTSRRGRGLANLSSRAAAMNGSLTIADASGGGTRVEADIPILPFDDAP